MYTSDEASLLMQTKKTSNAKVTINIDGIIDAYKITANKMSLKLMDATNGQLCVRYRLSTFF